MSRLSCLKPRENPWTAKSLSVRCLGTAIGLREGLLELSGLTSESFLQGRLQRRLTELGQLIEELEREANSPEELPTMKTRKRSAPRGGVKK